MTDDGEPIYPVVGYTASGRPVTADQVAGHLRAMTTSDRTNTLAVIALVASLVAGPLGIVLGHIARSEIKRTGERGGGIALCALIFGYTSLMLFVLAMIWVVAFYTLNA